MGSHAGQRFIGVADRNQVVGKRLFQRIAQTGHARHAQPTHSQCNKRTDDERREKLGRKLELTQDIHRVDRCEMRDDD